MYHSKCYRLFYQSFCFFKFPEDFFIQLNCPCIANNKSMFLNSNFVVCNMDFWQ